MNSKGMELSVNFLVVMIVALVVFMLSIGFIYNVYKKAVDQEETSLASLDRQVEFLRCGSESVCIGEKTKRMNRGEQEVFAVRILNTQTVDRNFRAYVSNPDNNPVIFLPPETDDPDSDANSVREIKLGLSDSKNFGFMAKVPDTATSGTYIYDIHVDTQCKSDENDESIRECGSGTTFNSGSWVPFGENDVYKIIVIVN
jgi:uncharacterized membrane protein